MMKTFLVATLAAVFSSTAQAQPAASPVSTETAATREIDNVWLANAQANWRNYVDGQTNHMQQALDAFSDQDFRAAQLNLEAANAYLKLQQTVLMQAANELNRLAQQQTVPSLDQNASATAPTGTGNQSPASTEQQPTQNADPTRALDTHLQQARQAFVEGNYKRAAMGLRQGAAYMELAASSDTETTGTDDVEAAVDNLQEVANDVAEGTVTSVAVLDDAIEQARRVIQQQG